LLAFLPVKRIIRLLLSNTASVATGGATAAAFWVVPAMIAGILLYRWFGDMLQQR